MSANEQSTLPMWAGEADEFAAPKPANLHYVGREVRLERGKRGHINIGLGAAVVQRCGFLPGCKNAPQLMIGRSMLIICPADVMPGQGVRVTCLNSGYGRLRIRCEVSEEQLDEIFNGHVVIKWDERATAAGAIGLYLYRGAPYAHTHSASEGPDAGEQEAQAEAAEQAADSRRRRELIREFDAVVEDE
jgi:hypothetical protein